LVVSFFGGVVRLALVASAGVTVAAVAVVTVARVGGPLSRSFV
jgi:hypothetical protein